MNNTIELVRCLLADISDFTGLHLELPDEVGIDWFIIDAPKLDKMVLRLLEDNDVKSTPPKAIPDWLDPLFEAFYPELQLAEFEARAPSVESLVAFKAWRQLLLFCYKIEHAYTKTQLAEKTMSFLQVENEISAIDWPNKLNRDPFISRVRSLIQRVLQKSSRAELLGSILPSHGPGAVSPRKFPREKGRVTHYYPTIERWYPYSEWLYGLTDHIDMQRGMQFLKVVPDITCRMTAVPKDSRGPRLICVHPSESMWIQQGQRRWLEKLIKKSPLTKSSVYLDDQGPNGERARYASASRRYATLDLKDASDRLALGLFNYLFEGFEDILCAARATHCTMLDGSLVRLAKFAPMGNALTFPVEGLVFWAIAHATVTMDLGLKPQESDVTVFGDDLIVPIEATKRVIERLESYGFLVNRDKTFYKGFFRESCGVEAFYGFDVTPLRLRKGGVADILGAVAACDLAKRARIQGYDRLASRLYDWVRRWMGFVRVTVTNNPDCSGIVEYRSISFKEVSRLNGPKAAKFCKRTYRPMVRQIQVAARLDGTASSWWNVLDSLVRLESRRNPYSMDWEYVPFWDVPTQGLRVHTTFEGSTSKKGLVYTLPNRVRSRFGWTPAVF